MSFFARTTQPLSGLDGVINGCSDFFVRATPWMWWPAPPPRRDRPLGAGQHAVYLAWSAVGYVGGDVLAQRMPEEQRSTGRRLRTERVVTALLTTGVWVVTVGAWDRRAERLRRRPWQRLRR
jgi:hypothetical protein